MEYKDGWICGYPVSKAYKGKIPLCVYQTELKKVDSKNWIEYDIISCPGMSGSPVYIECKGKLLVVGIHHGKISGHPIACNLISADFCNQI